VVDWESVNTPLGLPGQRTAICVRTTHEPVDDATPAPAPEIRFYASSAAPDAAEFASVIRAHWRIENCLHHPKDRTWHEDRHWVGKPQTGAVLSMLRSVACCLIRRKKNRGLSADADCPERIEYYAHRPRAALRLIAQPLRL
jgi:predicted transposase YbfD/YdcC